MVLVTPIQNSEEPFSYRVKTTLTGSETVFDQTFVKSLVNSLRVRDALWVGAAGMFFVGGNGVLSGWMLWCRGHEKPRYPADNLISLPGHKRHYA